MKKNIVIPLVLLILFSIPVLSKDSNSPSQTDSYLAQDVGQSSIYVRPDYPGPSPLAKYQQTSTDEVYLIGTVFLSTILVIALFASVIKLTTFRENKKDIESLGFGIFSCIVTAGFLLLVIQLNFSWPSASYGNAVRQHEISRQDHADWERSIVMDSLFTRFNAEMRSLQGHDEPWVSEFGYELINEINRTRFGPTVIKHAALLRASQTASQVQGSTKGSLFSLHSRMEGTQTGITVPVIDGSESLVLIGWNYDLQKTIRIVIPGSEWFKGQLEPLYEKYKADSSSVTGYYKDTKHTNMAFMKHYQSSFSLISDLAQDTGPSVDDLITLFNDCNKRGEELILEGVAFPKGEQLLLADTLVITEMTSKPDFMQNVHVFNGTLCALTMQYLTEEVIDKHFEAKQLQSAMHN